MTDVARVTGSGLAGTGWTMRSLEVVDDPKRRLDQLVPLLHDLVAWDLVHRAADGSFVLRDDVQERLALLSTERPARSAQVYIGRKCEHCGRVVLTRMVDGDRICAACSRASLTVGDTDGDDVPTSAKGGRGFFHRHRRAS